MQHRTSRICVRRGRRCVVGSGGREYVLEGAMVPGGPALEGGLPALTPAQLIPQFVIDRWPNLALIKYFWSNLILSGRFSEGFPEDWKEVASSWAAWVARREGGGRGVIRVVEQEGEEGGIEGWCRRRFTMVREVGVLDTSSSEAESTGWAPGWEPAGPSTTGTQRIIEGLRSARSSSGWGEGAAGGQDLPGLARRYSREFADTLGSEVDTRGSEADTRGSEEDTRGSEANTGGSEEDTRGSEHGDSETSETANSREAKSAPEGWETLGGGRAGGVAASGGVEAERSEGSSVLAFQPRAAITTRAQGAVKVATSGSYRLLEGGRGEGQRGRLSTKELADRPKKRQAQSREKEVYVKRVKKIVTVVDEKEKEVIRDLKNMEEMADEEDEFVAKKKRSIVKKKSGRTSRGKKVEAKVPMREDGAEVVGGTSAPSQEKIMKRTKERTKRKDRMERNDGKEMIKEKTKREDTKERKEAEGMAEQPEQSTPSPSVSKGKTRASRRRRGGVGRGAGCVVARRVLGFWVEREVVVDEPPGPCPDTGGARCAVCGADFPGTRSVVEHLAREHGVRSRPPLLLTARRLQEAGYFLPGTQGDQEEPRGV